MKNSISTLLLLLLVIPACKKSSSTGSNNNSNGSYYIKFKLDGVQTEFDSDAMASFSYNASEALYTAVFVAYKDVNAGSKNDVTITLFSSSAVAAGSSYNDPAKARETNGTPLPVNTIFYFDSTGLGYLTAGSLSDANGNIPIAGVVANAQLTVTAMTSTTITGTFSGTVYKSSNFGQYHSITSGQFNLKRAN